MTQIRGSKKGGGRAPVEQADTLRSIQRAEIIDLVSEGPIVGPVNGLKSVYLDGVPVENPDGSRNFDNVDFAWSVGTQGQAALDGFDLVQSETAVGLLVAQATPVVRSIGASDVDTVRVTINIPRLTRQSVTNGDIGGSSVEFAIDIQSNGGGFTEVYRTTIDGKTASTYTREIRLPLLAQGPGPWDVRVRRITEDPADSSISNEIYWASFTSITSARLRYPNSAVMGLRVGADQFQRIPVRGYDVLGRVVQVPSNYDPYERTYTGSWDGTFVPAWTNNPAWVWYDLVLNPRFGLGRYIQAQHVNKWRLYQIAQYCDELVPDGRGGMEPRFACNLYLQDEGEALQVLRDLAAVFRCMVLYGNSVVDLVQDAPDDAYDLFVPGKVEGGQFVYESSSSPRRHSGCIVYWNNLSNQGKREPELFQDPELVAKYGVRNMEISPLATWSRGQAVRLAKWALYSEDAEGEVVSFVVGSAGALVPLGRVFKIADPSVSGERLGGLVRSATTSTVTLDAPVALQPGEGYTLHCQLPDAVDGLRLETQARTVTNLAGETQTIELSEPYSAAPLAGSAWVLESTAVAATTWRCLHVKELSGTNRYQITAVAHDPGKYARIEQGLILEPRPISRLSDRAIAPTDVDIEEHVYASGTSNRNRISISWVPVIGGQRYRVSWRHNNGAWTQMADTSAQLVELVDLDPGQLEVAVRGVNGLGNVSPPATATAEIFGKVDRPATPTGVTATVRPNGWEIAWDAPEEHDVTGTEVRLGGADWDDAPVVFRGAANRATIPFMLAGTHILRLKHFASTRYSQDAAEFELVVLLPAAPPHQNTLISMGSVEIRYGSGETSQPLLRHHFRLGDGLSSWETASQAGTAAGDARSHTIVLPNPGAYRVFWRAEDRGGNLGAVAFDDVVTTINDIDGILDSINDSINSGHLVPALRDEIDLISGNGAGSVNARLGALDGALQGQIDVLQAELSEIAGAPDYDNGETYLAGDLVKYEGGLYRALQATTGNPPSNTTYWEYIGAYASLAEAVSAHAAMLSAQEQRIDDTEDGLLAIASDVNALEARMDDAESDITAQANALSSLTTAVGTHDGQLSAQAQQLNTLQVSIARGPVLPSDFSAGMLYWTSSRGGAPETVPQGTWSVVDDDSHFGRCAVISGWAVAGNNIMTRGVVPAVAGRIYRCTAKFKVVTLPPDGAVSMNIIASHLTETYANPSSTFGTGTSVNVAGQVVEVSLTIADTASAGVFAWAAGTKYLRFGFRLNSNEAAAPVLRVQSIQVEDITALSAAVQQEASVRASETGHLAAYHGLRAQVSGGGRTLVGGMGIMGTSAPGEGPTIDIGFLANKIFFGAPAGSGVPDRFPFSIITTPTVENGILLEPGIYADAAFFRNVTALLARFGTAWVQGDMIAGGAVKASHAQFGDTSNIYPDYDMVDPGFYTAAAGEAYTFGGTSVQTYGQRFLQINANASERDVRSGLITLEASTEYYIEAVCGLAAAGTAGAQIYIELFSLNASGVTTWTRSVLVMSRPNSTSSVRVGMSFTTTISERRMRVLFRRTAGGDTNTRYGGVVLRRKIGAALVVTGGIKADHIDAQVINTHHLVVGAVTAASENNIAATILSIPNSSSAWAPHPGGGGGFIGVVETLSGGIHDAKATFTLWFRNLRTQVESVSCSVLLRRKSTAGSAGTETSWGQILIGRTAPCNDGSGLYREVSFAGTIHLPITEGVVGSKYWGFYVETVLFRDVNGVVISPSTGASPHNANVYIGCSVSVQENKV